MRKFLNRPLLALAAALGLVFLVILARMYFNVIDKLSESLMVREYNSKNSNAFDEDRSKWKLPMPKAVIQGPQLPITTITTKNIEITLGTFEALAGTCFLQKGFKYSSIYNKSDKFDDLWKIVKMFPHDIKDNPAKTDTLENLLDLSLSDSSEPNSLNRFLLEINRYHMYSKGSDAVDNVIYDMKTQPFRSIAEKTDGDTQFRMIVKFSNDVVALFKPIRVTRKQQALPNQMYFTEYERHTSEIASFTLDRVLGFNKALPVVGRTINMVVDMLRIAPSRLQRTFYVSPKPDENVCFTGNCEQFCDAYHPICGNGTSLEGSFIAYLPDVEGFERKTKTHPWAQSHSGQSQRKWETDPEYCDKIIKLELYSKGRMLLELIDMSIFDFLIGNTDRDSYQMFETFGNDTFPIRLDHGHAFKKAYHDELKILAPLLQCCLIKSSTLQTLLEVHNSNKPLSARMRASMANDPVAPVLWEPHLDAVDRRLATVLQTIRDCIKRRSADDVLVTEDTISFA